MKIAVDCGHGSNTAGKRTPDGYREHYANVMVGNYLYAELIRCGFDAIKVGWDDTNAMDDEDTSLATRQRIIKDNHCNISVSVHFNASGDGVNYNDAQGVSTYIHSVNVRDSKRLAQLVQSKLIQGTEQVNRGVLSNAFAMVNCSALGTNASILCELAFMTNRYEAGLMESEAFCQECAIEICQGVCQYANVDYVGGGSVPEPQPQPTPSEPAPSDTTPTNAIPMKMPSTVSAFQSWMNDYFGMGLDVDGKYGPKSELANRKVLQILLNNQGAGLAVDGQLGPKSKAAILQYGVVGKGDRSVLVTLWQATLVAHRYNPNGIDGIFGPGCVAATKLAQQERSLTQDGMVGPATWTGVLS